MSTTQHDLIDDENSGKASVANFQLLANHSWLTQLVEDPTARGFEPNKLPREVKSGHYVPVKPTPLLMPRVIGVAEEVGEMLGLDKASYHTDEFRRFFSGDVAAMPAFKSWCTGYALSIYGSEMTDQCPFRTGNAYGDGRAISIGEVLNEGNRYEFQLKGAGRTPYARGADGRAVLRSSIREFLGSEANHYLGVSTTRALSLIASQSEQVVREWKGDVTSETVAITCRVAPSFMRVGHLELYSRRTRGPTDATARSSGQVIGREEAIDELRMIVEHAMYREYGGKSPYPRGTALGDCGGDLQERILDMMNRAARKFAELTAQWIRVGFCQGNFNSDNTLIAGRTMDYGPFGYIERFKPDWSSWVGGGHHFSFRNQPVAGSVNFQMFATAVAPLLDTDGRAELLEIVRKQVHLAGSEVQDVYRRKLGLVEWTSVCNTLLQKIEGVMEKLGIDYTMFWRELSKIPRIAFSDTSLLDGSAVSTEQFSRHLRENVNTLVQPLIDVDMFFKAIVPADEKLLGDVMVEWLLILRIQLTSRITSDAVNDYSSLIQACIESMRAASPKYVLREWMLEDAYRAAQDRGDYSLFYTLYELIKKPYDEQIVLESLFYKRSTQTGVTKIT